MHPIRIYQIMIVEEYLNMAYYYTIGKTINCWQLFLPPNTSIGRRLSQCRENCFLATSRYESLLGAFRGLYRHRG